MKNLVRRAWLIVAPALVTHELADAGVKVLARRATPDPDLLWLLIEHPMLVPVPPRRLPGVTAWFRRHEDGSTSVERFTPYTGLLSVP